MATSLRPPLNRSNSNRSNGSSSSGRHNHYQYHYHNNNGQYSVTTASNTSSGSIPPASYSTPILPSNHSGGPSNHPGGGSNPTILAFGKRVRHFKASFSHVRGSCEISSRNSTASNNNNNVRNENRNHSDKSEKSRKEKSGTNKHSVTPVKLVTAPLMQVWNVFFIYDRELCSKVLKEALSLFANKNNFKWNKKIRE